MTVRGLEPEDATAVYEIERDCFGDPWTADALSSASKEKGRSVFVAVDDGRPVGYGMIQQVLDECEILRIAVSPRFRRNGAGKLLMEEMIKAAYEKGARIYYLEVRESNTAAIGLYKKLKFTESGMRNGYYSNPTENAILMSRAVTG